jgi:threonyl-tRNA synthetase
MPVITLPDGSQKTFAEPVTVDAVAASIGAGLRKAALAGRSTASWSTPRS